MVANVNGGDGSGGSILISYCHIEQRGEIMAEGADCSEIEIYSEEKEVIVAYGFLQKMSFSRNILFV